MDRVCFGSRIGLRARLILERVAQGDEDARHELLDRVYGELRQLATRKMSREAPGQTLQPTALVHEAWLKLCGYDDPRWEDRRQFVAFTLEETAEALGVSVPTAIRWWAFSRAWLLHRMEGTADPLR